MNISYFDSEVNVFHPICEKAINMAIELAELCDEYRVIHHQYSGSLEMDFVIQNIKTGKYLCVIEVKRTPSDLHSARYQYQAMSYVQQNISQNEKPFYILTNLEYSFEFRYDSSRPRVFQQILKPGLLNISSFEEDENVFFSKLVNYFRGVLERFIANDYSYSITLDEFARHIEKLLGNSKKWKSHLVFLLYEYIRGAFSFVNRKEYKDIRLFNRDLSRICIEAAKVNFKEIFDCNQNEYERTALISNELLVDLFEFGSQNVTGDSLAGLMHEIVSRGHEHEGEVPTDLELATLVAVLTKNVSGPIEQSKFICDPAAGSGNLISSAIDIYNLLPNQIIANDVNPRLLELLSLRIGLKFASTISKNNSPRIFCFNIADLDSSFFDDVRVVILNPPFVAGINSVSRKQALYDKIRQLRHGKDPITFEGQMPLEAVFLELLCLLVAPDTTIGVVFPKNHLLARGNEAKAIRKLLLHNFGLQTVFTYPGNNIFMDVTKETCLLVGKVGVKNETGIKVLSTYDKIPDIDIHRFEKGLSENLNQEFSQVSPGTVAKIISPEDLHNAINDGWRDLNSEMSEAINFLKRHFENNALFVTLNDLNVKLKRGVAGNSGGSDLMFYDKNSSFISNFITSIIPSNGLRNAKLNDFLLYKGDNNYLDVSINSSLVVEQILEEYSKRKTSSFKQQRDNKSKEDLLDILKKESRNPIPENVILIPRAIRTTGRIYLTKSKFFVSTNFVICSDSNYENITLLASWMTTIFYQLICEVSSKDQEGMRKMEIKDILTTYVPDLSKISDETIEAIKNATESIKFLDLKNPIVRPIDMIWAKELFKEDAAMMLQRSSTLLTFLSNKRDTKQ